MKKLNAGIVGATGMVGQRFITLLQNHPYFNLTALVASSRTAGQRYEDAVAGRWKMKTPVPDSVKDMIIIDSENIDEVKKVCDFVFCAVSLKKDETKALEERYAKAEIPVISNNSANRWTDDVPMVIPEINASHFEIINEQKKRLGTKKGFIAVKPNCSIQSYVPMLTPLLKYGIKEVAVTTYQAISGAGKDFNSWPEMIDNVIPFISGEEEKSEMEPLKVWGSIKDGKIVKLEGPVISAQCIRVPVTDGHTAAVFVTFENKPTKEQIIKDWNEYTSVAQEMKLPHAPEKFITYFEEDSHPQIKDEREIYGGMGITAGRLREDTIFDYKFVGMSHNTLRGAAGGGMESAELLYRLGYLY